MTNDISGFMNQFLRDQERGDVRPLDEYQRRFPGHEVEHEYQRALGLRPNDSPSPALLSSAVGADAAFATRRLVERLQAHPPADGRYRRLDRIGSGGMGHIVRIADDELRRSIAMKRLHRTGDKALATFIDEAQITAQLEHPGIVPVHDLGVDPDGTPYFTMRYVKGRTLSDVLDLARKGDPDWTEARVLSAILRVCEALAYAHSKRVIHRDIKPANIMCGEFGEIYVMDWGVARVLDADAQRSEASSDQSIHTTFRDEAVNEFDSPLVTRAGDVLGTPFYMPPEQALGQVDALGPWSDVYAVGAILYQLLTGCPPYADGPSQKSWMATLLRVCTEPPTPILELNRKVSGELLAICGRAMARDRNERYPDMRAMADDLRAYLEQRVVRAYKVGAWQELKKWCTRNKLAASLAAVFTVLAGLGVGLLRDQVRAKDYAVLRQRVSADVTSLPLQCAQRGGAYLQRIEALADELLSLSPLDPADRGRCEKWLERNAALREDVDSGKGDVVRRWPEFLGVNQTNVPKTSSRRYRSAYADGQSALALDRHAALLDRLSVRHPPAWADVRAQLETYRNEHAGVWLGRDSLIFAEEPHRDQYDQLVPLVDALLRMYPTGDARLSIAGRVRAQLDGGADESHASTGAERAAWEHASASIRDVAQCPKYGGLSIRPQAGLVPLGRHPVSGLWEFAHERSGTLPTARVEGEWEIDADSCIVLVLLPARTIEHVPTPDVEPFFLSVREITLGQWLRSTIDLPPSSSTADLSGSSPELARPVVDVSWDEAAWMLISNGLVLPTEAQWDYAVTISLGMRDLADHIGEWMRDDYHAHSSFETQAASAKPAIKVVRGRFALAGDRAQGPSTREPELTDARRSWVGVRPARVLVP